MVAMLSDGCGRTEGVGLAGPARAHRAIGESLRVVVGQEVALTLTVTPAPVRPSHDPIQVLSVRYFGR